ncbi:hypothetical protein ABHN03_25445 [Paenibacillus sp. NRS-1775]|uniref:hypothetical protein n=1 Tax=unclassified Paenibacillus TaxID=185978 RepID=UPI003D299949
MLNKANIDKQFVQEALLAAEKAGGYLTTDLFDQYRDKTKTVSWDTFNRKNKISFKVFLKEVGILNKDEYMLKQNKIKAISNFKLLNLKNGSVDKIKYDGNQFKPSWDYISEHYGIEKIAAEAQVIITGQYLSEQDLLSTLKNSIKNIGYIPSRLNYINLKLKPSEKSMKTKGLTWDQSMRKANFKPEGIKTNDLICKMDNCFNQFTPNNENDILCDSCFKKMRSKLVTQIESMSKIDDVREITKKLIWFGSDQKLVFDLYKK